MVRVLVNAVVVKDNKILVIKRSLKEKHAPGKWSVPGGSLEIEEGHYVLENTARREVFEETGIKIKPKMELLVNNIFHHTEDKEPVLAIVFFCQYDSGEIKVDKSEITEARWIKEEDLNSLEFNHPNVKNYIKKGFQRASEISTTS